MQKFFHVCIYGNCSPVGGFPVKMPPNDLKHFMFL